MAGSRIVKWAGGVNSPSAREYFAVIERSEDKDSQTARHAFLGEMVRQTSEVGFLGLHAVRAKHDVHR